MEDTLRVKQSHMMSIMYLGLNPCSNGRCSARMEDPRTKDNIVGLNPCSNGRCSARDVRLLDAYQKQS